MAKDNVSFPSKNLDECCDCGCSCSLTTDFSDGTWIRSVKRKYDEYERSGRFYIPGVDILPVARVGIENECALLRETVSSQQLTIQDLCLELDEERNASSSAANEAMSMILRLQGEKAEIQMEARQFKRFTEERITHDGQEISALEDLLYKREQTVQALTCEIQACKHRMMSYGLTEYEAEGMNENFSRNASFSTDVDYPMNAYPPLRCNFNEPQGQSEFEDDVGIDKYPFGETPRSHDLKHLEYRINQLEETPHDDEMNEEFGNRPALEKIIVGHSPRRSGHSRRVSTDNTSSLPGLGRDTGPDYSMDSPRFGTSFKKLGCVSEELRKSDSASAYEDEMSDRVYTIDSMHPGAPYNNFTEPKVNAKLCDEYVHADMGEPEVKKLYLRLQALEADRESMRQTVMSMQTDKAQLVLLREIAQQLCRDMTTAKPMPAQKLSVIRSFSVFTVFKWMLSFVIWKKKALRSKYVFDLTPNNVGLLMLLDKSPHGKLWRCVRSTQLRK